MKNIISTEKNEIIYERKICNTDTRNYADREKDAERPVTKVDYWSGPSNIMAKMEEWDDPYRRAALMR